MLDDYEGYGGAVEEVGEGEACRPAAVDGDIWKWNYFFRVRRKCYDWISGESRTQPVMPGGSRHEITANAEVKSNQEMLIDIFFEKHRVSRRRIRYDKAALSRALSWTGDT